MNTKQVARFGIQYKVGERRVGIEIDTEAEREKERQRERKV